MEVLKPTRAEIKFSEEEKKAFAYVRKTLEGILEQMRENDYCCFYYNEDVMEESDILNLLDVFYGLTSNGDTYFDE